MTGEVSLRGGILPIGGLPEKLMAAQRAGITKVFIPAENVDDLEDVAEEVKSRLEIIPVKKVTDVLGKLLNRPSVFKDFSSSKKRGRRHGRKYLSRRLPFLQFSVSCSTSSPR